MAADTTARFQASLVDHLGVRGSVVSHLFIDSAQTVANVATALGAWATDLDAITTGGFVGVRAEILPGLGGLTTAPDVDSRMSEAGNWSFLPAGATYRYTQVVQALSDAIISGSEIDPTNADVVAWQALLQGAVLGGHYVDLSNRSLAAALKSTFLSTRKHRKREHEMSYNVSP